MNIYTDMNYFSNLSVWYGVIASFYACYSFGEIKSSVSAKILLTEGLEA